MIKQVRGLKPSKIQKLERDATRQQDMPVCATCLKTIFAAAVQGYDGKWRDLRCHNAHIDDVFLEAGESAPVPSDDTQSFAPYKRDPAAEKKRQDKAKAVLEKYGVHKRDR